MKSYLCCVAWTRHQARSTSYFTAVNVEKHKVTQVLIHFLKPANVVLQEKKKQCTQISLFLGYTWITSFHLSFKESSCTIAGGAVNHTQWDFHLWLCNLLFAAFFAGFLLLYLSRINITPQLMLLNDCIRMIWGLSGPLSQFLSPVMSVKSIRWKIGRILNETGTEFIKFELI